MCSFSGTSTLKPLSASVRCRSSDTDSAVVLRRRSRRESQGLFLQPFLNFTSVWGRNGARGTQRSAARDQLAHSTGASRASNRIGLLPLVLSKPQRDTNKTFTFTNTITFKRCFPFRTPDQKKKKTKLSATYHVREAVNSCS